MMNIPKAEYSGGTMSERNAEIKERVEKIQQKPQSRKNKKHLRYLMRNQISFKCTKYPDNVRFPTIKSIDAKKPNK